MIIADDFTGALDSGVQLAQSGAKVRVITANEIDWKSINKDVEVLVINTETRHSDWKIAYSIVYEISKAAKEEGIPYILKKTDSGLRGNVGCELTALLEASGEKFLPFIPAFPQMKRITKGGIHYIDGTPVANSVFGLDPFDPVKYSKVSDIISERSKVKVISVEDVKDYKAVIDKDGIIVFDSETIEDIKNIASYLKEEGNLKIMSGCAGLASILPKLLNLEKDLVDDIDLKGDRLITLCGSVNPISIRQVEYAEEKGFTRFQLRPEEKADKNFWTSKEGEEKFKDLAKEFDKIGNFIIDSSDPVKGNLQTKEYAIDHSIELNKLRENVAISMGKIFSKLLEEEVPGVILITGGDTLLSSMNEIDIHEIEPIRELEDGVVLSKISYEDKERLIISKSGGFGKEDLLLRIVDKINKQ